MPPEDIIPWLDAATEPAYSKDQIVEYYQMVSPRTVFLKSVPTGSAGIDLGAGDGGTAILLNWPGLPRSDIRLFAVSMQYEKGLEAYEEAWIGNFERMLPAFSVRTFDFILCCHFVEHIRDVQRFFGWVSAVLEPGGRLYLEWPHPDAKHLPRREDIYERGFHPIISTFYDDPSHIESWDPRELARIAERCGLSVTAWSQIKSPWLADQMRNVALRGGGGDVELTFAIWAHVGWAQYAVIEKPRLRGFL